MYYHFGEAISYTYFGIIIPPHYDLEEDLGESGTLLSVTAYQDSCVKGGQLPQLCVICEKGFLDSNF